LPCPPTSTTCAGWFLPSLRSPPTRVIGRSAWPTHASSSRTDASRVAVHWSPSTDMARSVGFATYIGMSLFRDFVASSCRISSPVRSIWNARIGRCVGDAMSPGCAAEKGFSQVDVIANPPRSASTRMSASLRRPRRSRRGSARVLGCTSRSRHAAGSVSDNVLVGRRPTSSSHHRVLFDRLSSCSRVRPPSICSDPA